MFKSMYPPEQHRTSSNVYDAEIRTLTVEIRPIVRHQSALKPANMLCTPCMSFVTSVRRQNFAAWKYNDYGINASLEYAHSTYVTLQASALAGCDFCKCFHAESEKLKDARPWLCDETTRFTLDFSFYKGDAHEPKFDCRVVAYTASNLQGCPFLTFTISQTPACTPAALLKQSDLPLRPLEVSSRPDSEWCIGLAKFWMDECESSHTSCTRQGYSQLPTRVIDVGPPNGSADPKLVITNGIAERYIALSYCWGQDKTLVTSQALIHQHQESIPIHSLPKTLRDAVLFTRLLDFRYLWIDALCIIQDDDEDWESEVADMGRIYESSSLVIAVLDAEKSDSGFLNCRESDGSIVRADTTEISIKPAAALTNYWFRGGRLETRAWTLQERILAPSVLHIGAAEIYWECCQGLASESRPMIREEGVTESDSYYGRSVHDLKTLVLNQVPSQSVSIWYELIIEYTNRGLTRPTDRLPAIQGLAAKFETCMGCQYSYGLWSNDLHCGLLWSISDEGETDEFQRNEGYPSWSWAAIEAHINYRITLPSSLDPMSTVVPVESPITSAQTNRNASKSCLRVQSRHQTGVIHLAKGLSRNCEFLPMTSESLFDSVHCTMDTLDHTIEVVKLGEDFISAREFRCVLVARQKDEHFSSYHFLILERLQFDDRFGVGDRRFKRVGVGRQETINDVEPAVLAGAAETEILVV